MSSTKVLLLIGSGPGIARSTAQLFAAKGFKHIALLSRSASNLEIEKAAVTSIGNSTAEVKTWAVDVINKPKYVQVLKEVGAWSGGKVDVVIYNAARVSQSKFFEIDDEQIVNDFSTTTLALHTTLQYTLPYLQHKDVTHPSLFVTSSRIAFDPAPEIFKLGMAKASQLALVKTLQKGFGGEIHVAAVYVTGLVGPDQQIQAGSVADEFWGLWEDESGKWRQEVDVN